MRLKAILCRTSTKKQLRNAYYKITLNLLFEYQCTSGKFIRLPNRIEKIDSVARIESSRIETFFARIGMLYWPPGWLKTRKVHETSARSSSSLLYQIFIDLKILLAGSAINLSQFGYKQPHNTLQLHLCTILPCNCTYYCFNPAHRLQHEINHYYYFILLPSHCVATYARCGEIFNNNVSTYLPRNLPVKKLTIG